LKDAVGDSLIPSNPCENVKPPKVVQKEILYLDKPQTATLLGAAMDTDIYSVVFLAVTTGMRRGELLALRWADVNFDDRWIKVRRSLEQAGQKLSFKDVKSKSGRRRITISTATIETLRLHLVKQSELRL